LTVPDDGALQFGGLLPAVIQWESEAHPAGMLEDRGCSLSTLRLSHPAATSLVPLFRELRVAGPVDLKPGPKSLVADIMCPRGTVAVS
jgi:hypothetical protein